MKLYLFHRKKYAKDLLKRFNIHHCKNFETSMNTRGKLQMNDGIGNVNIKKYIGMVGGWWYLAHTRPDIYFFLQEFYQGS